MFIYVTVAVFLLELLWHYVFFRTSTASTAIIEWGKLKPVAVVVNFQDWRLITHLFLDLSPIALLFNMLAIFWFGNDLEELHGTRSYAVLFLGGGLVSGLAFCILGYLIWPGSYFMGPSGAILAMLVAAALTWPDRRVVCIIFPVKLKYLVLILVGLDIYNSITALGVASLAHLVGAAWAFGYWKLKDRIHDGLEAMDHRWLIRTDRRSREQSLAREAEVDAILKKISVSGINSLTSQERRLLETESERKRSR